MSLSSTELAALLAGPALAAPTGVRANFDNPPNNNGLAWFVTTFCMVIATVSICIRMYAKLWPKRRAHAEEILMLCAYGAYWGTAYAAYKMIYTPGYYVHQWNLHNKDIIEPLHLILIYGCSYSATLALVKTAILIDWCRIFVPGDRITSFFWWCSTFVIFVQLSWGLACIILLNVQCIPHAAIWEFYLPSKCYSMNKVMLTSASVQVFSDFTMVLLPQKIIWGLRINWQKKFGVSIIFGVGILACVSACFRLSTTVTFSKQADEMYYIAPLLFWACAEMTCGFFILCVPCITGILKELRLPSKIKDIFGSGLKSSNNASNPNSNTYGRANALSFHKRPKVGMDPNDAWSSIDDEESGLPLNTLKPSESQEHLRMQQGEEAMNIMRKTHTIVISDSHSAQSDSEVGDKPIPWTT